MDAFTVSVNKSIPTPPVANQTPIASQPKSSFRIIFLLLLLAILASAIATTYILMTGNTPKIASDNITAQTATENPFADEAQTTKSNPFTDFETLEKENLNEAALFEEETSENFFAQFETQETSTGSTEYENPF